MNSDVPRHLINQHVKGFSPELQSGPQAPPLSDPIRAPAVAAGADSGASGMPA